MVRRPGPERVHRLDGLDGPEASPALGAPGWAGRIRRRSAAGAGPAQPARLVGRYGRNGDGDRAGPLVEGLLEHERRLRVPARAPRIERDPRPTRAGRLLARRASGYRTADMGVLGRAGGRRAGRRLWSVACTAARG